MSLLWKRRYFNVAIKLRLRQAFLLFSHKLDGWNRGWVVQFLESLCKKNHLSIIWSFRGEIWETALYYLGLIVWNISNCEQWSKKKCILKRRNIFGGGWKKGTINHINLVNLNNTPQHLSLSTLAAILTFSPLAGRALCSQQLPPSPLPAFRSTFSPAQRTAVREHADVLLLFSAARI